MIERQLTSSKAFPSFSCSKAVVRLVSPKLLKKASRAACSFFDMTGDCEFPCSFYSIITVRQLALSKTIMS